MNEFSKVKRYGSIKSGSHHWLMQRITALIMIPFILWFLICFLKMLLSPDQYIPLVFSSLWNVVFMILFTNAAIYHGYLGFRVIIEDYVHKHFLRNSIIIFALLTSLITVIAFDIGAFSLYLRLT